MKISTLPPSLSLAALALLRGAPLPTNAFLVPSNTPRRSNPVQPPPARRPAAAALSSSTSRDPYASPELDADALGKYAASAATELALFGAAFSLLDLAVAQLDVALPLPAIALVFYAASLKSRVFNPLNNDRPDRSRAVDGEGSAGFRDRVMPSWTPPGIVFPIMWVLIVGPLRAYSSALVVSSTGAFLSLPTMAFVLHLTVGDVWNTINNAEKRYGAAVAGVLCVLASAAHAAYQYSQVDPFAGQLLGATCVWLAVASALIADTWRLNPAENGERVPLYPVKGEADTSFLWFNSDKE